MMHTEHSWLQQVDASRKQRFYSYHRFGFWKHSCRFGAWTQGTAMSEDWTMHVHSAQSRRSTQGMAFLCASCHSVYCLWNKIYASSATDIILIFINTTFAKFNGFFCGTLTGTAAWLCWLQACAAGLAPQRASIVLKITCMNLRFLDLHRWVKYDAELRDTT